MLEQFTPIIIVLVVALILWFVFKKVVKIMLYLGIIILVLLALGTYAIYQDSADLRKNFSGESKKVILVDDRDVLTGFYLTNRVMSMSSPELQSLTLDLRNEQYEKVLGDSYKLMLFDIATVENLEQEFFDLGEVAIKKQQALDVLTSNRPYTVLVAAVGDAHDLPINRNSEANKVKATVFALILANEILDPAQPLYFFSEIKQDRIFVYPETPLFTALQFLPITFLQETAEKLFVKAVDTTEEFFEE